MAEVELKLAVPPDALAALRERLAQFGRGRTRRVDTTYFDSSDHRLAGAGAAVRLRRIGAQWMQSLKVADGDAALATRGEWEVAAPANQLNWARFPADVRRRTLTRLRLGQMPPLEPQFQTRFARTTWNVMVDGANVEIALDIGQIVAGHGRGRRHEPLCELELELKAGRRDALLRLARAIVRPAGSRVGKAGLPLLPQPLSKAARGHRLTQAAAAAAKADRRRIVGSVQASLNAAQALRAILTAGGDVLWINVQGALCHDDPEFVHQARVAIRRMRSAIRLFRDDVDFPPSLARELRWIGRTLGPVRDADVLLSETLPCRLPRSPAPADVARTERVLAAARRRRDATRARMRDQLLSGRCAAAAIALMTWACVRQGAGSAGGRPRSLQDLAPKRLATVYRKLTAAARFFRALSARRQHRVRILTKRLRYAIDVFHATLPRAQAARFSRAVERAQDALGALNDAAAGARAIRASNPITAETTPVSADAAGELELIAVADRALSELLALPVPWRVRTSPD